MTITKIKDNTQALLVDMGLFKTVLAAPPAGDNDFLGYPSVAHFFIGAESDYATVSQNRRRYEYVIEVYSITAQDIPTATELSRIYSLTESVVQMLEESIDLSSTALSLTPACDIMRVSPSMLERVQTSEGTGLRLAVRMFCEADVSYRP